jgi:hypothetical protein
MNINNAFPSKWLKSGDAEEDLTLTIKSVAIEEVGSGDNTEQKPVLYFDETEKGMVLNKTNAETISTLHTPETDNWIGNKITLFATEVDFGGKQTLALRVRMRAPKKSQTVSGGAMTAFWAKAYELGIEQKQAKEILDAASGNPVTASDMLDNPA